MLHLNFFNHVPLNKNADCPLPGCLFLTCPKLTAACWAEAVNTTTVRYSISSSRDFRDLGNSVPTFFRQKDKLSLDVNKRIPLYTDCFIIHPFHNAVKQMKCRKGITTLRLCQCHHHIPVALCLQLPTICLWQQIRNCNDICSLSDLPPPENPRLIKYWKGIKDNIFLLHLFEHV